MTRSETPVRSANTSQCLAGDTDSFGVLVTRYERLLYNVALRMLNDPEDALDVAQTVFVKAYAHNGYFKTLKQIVHFYSTRDVKPTCPDPFTTVEDALAQDCWPAPEVPVNVNTKELGDLHLTRAQEDAIVAFMKTLSDGFMD